MLVASNLKNNIGRLVNGNTLELVCLRRNLSVSASRAAKDNYKLLIVGGGSGGVTMSAKFAKILGPQNVAIVEPNEWHYYQPGWTLVASGLKKLENLRRQESSLIPKGVDWHKTKASEFDPENNSVTLADGKKLKYDYMVVATGIYIDLDGIKGLREALKNDSDVVTMYSPSDIDNVFKRIQSLKSGEAIFTFPKPPIKCPGAPQKIMYLAEDYFRKHGVRDKVNVSYCTALPVIFGVKKYAAALMEIVKARNINLQTQTCLVEVDYKNKQAIFEKLDKPGTFVNRKYNLLHVCPPMRPVDEIKKSKLVDASGFVDVSKETLQHKKYPNVFGIGDCTTLPTSKTAAAIAVQSKVLFNNLRDVMEKKNGEKLVYDGYTSCPLLTQYGKLILAEFDYDGNPMETFPMDQGKESRILYYMKKDFMPELYWNSFLKGNWEGPGAMRTLFWK